jgi:nicotinamidase-related amidase
VALLERDRAALIVVDIQEGFRPYDVFEPVAHGAAKLVEGARILDVPIIVSEQYPKGLGTTAPEVGLNGARKVPVPLLVEKTVFSAARAEGFDLGDRDQALVCGIEAHVCVSQTVHDLLDRGIDVHVCADAVGSRHQVDYDRALPRLEKAGAVVTTIEAALLELCERAGTPEFKAVQGLIK